MPHLTSDETSLISSTTPLLIVHGAAITTLFYETLLTAHPTLKNIFNATNQHTASQPLALASALQSYAANISNLSALSPTVELICNKHASLGVQPEQYALVGEHLLQAMKDVLKADLSDEAASACEKAYWQLAEIMIGRERDLYEEAELWKGWVEWRVERKERVALDIKSFYLVPVQGKGEAGEEKEKSVLPEWRPGQYVSVRVWVEELGCWQARQYSISERMGMGYLRITVKREEGERVGKSYPGYMSNLLHDKVDVGDVVQVSHPFGDFFLDEEDERGESPLVLIGGGVGITPLLSILKNVLGSEKGKRRSVTLVHTAKDKERRPYHDELVKLAHANSSLRIVFFDSKAFTEDAANATAAINDTSGALNVATYSGRMNLSRLRDLGAHGGLHLEDERTKYFVCGPTGFMLSTKRILKEWGVNADRVCLELFGSGGVTEASG